VIKPYVHEKAVHVGSQESWPHQVRQTWHKDGKQRKSGFCKNKQTVKPEMYQKKNVFEITCRNVQRFVAMAAVWLYVRRHDEVKTVLQTLLSIILSFYYPIKWFNYFNRILCADENQSDKPDSWHHVFMNLRNRAGLRIKQKRKTCVTSWKLDEVLQNLHLPTCELEQRHAGAVVTLLGQSLQACQRM